MSYILDALRKSERERRVGAMPGIDSVVTDDSPRPTLPATRWLVALLVLNFVMIGAAAWWWSQRAPQNETTAAPIPPPPAIARTDPMLAPVTSTPALIVLEPTRAEIPAPVPESPALSDSPAPAPQKAAESTAVRPLSGEVAVPAEDAEPYGAEHPPRGRVVVAGAEPAPRDSERVPRLDEMSLAFQQSLPPLSLDVHVYDDAPARRFALINMSRYREGDPVQDGLRLQRITLEGVVMQYHGERFLLPRP